MTLSNAAQADPTPAKVIVFVPPRDIEEPLRDALTAQLSGVAAELVVEHFAAATQTFKNSVSESHSFAAAHQAIGVFWLDARRAQEWLVFLAEPAGNRILMRRVPLGPDGSAAAIEAVAVIVRESTSALLAGQTIGMTEVVAPEEEPIPDAAPPRPKPVVPPPAPKHFAPIRGPSLATSYYGDLYAKDSGWQSGIGVAAMWGFSSGLRAGVSYVMFEPAWTESKNLSFLVRRRPLGAEIGYAYRKERWSLALSFRVTVELTTRHVVSATPPAQATADATRTVVFLSPRPRFDYRLTETLSLFGALGFDAAMNGFSFVNRVDGVDQTIFEPLRIRPGVEVGAAFWP